MKYQDTTTITADNKTVWATAISLGLLQFHSSAVAAGEEEEDDDEDGEDEEEEEVDGDVDEGEESDGGDLGDSEASACVA